MGDNFGIHRATGSRGNAAAIDERSQGQILSDFLLQLEDYTPTVVSEHFSIFVHLFI